MSEGREEIKKGAVLSHCGRYRYSLTRIWGRDDGRMVGWIMLNPSTADAEVDDPTIRRCMGFARDWGYEGIIVTNLFGCRATDPNELRRSIDPLGVANDVAIMAMVDRVSKPDKAGDRGLIVCAWGAHGDYLKQGESIRSWIEFRGAPLHHLGLTKKGQPRHPLYLKKDTKPQIWEVTDSE